MRRPEGTMESGVPSGRMNLFAGFLRGTTNQ
jgi:hypothetical protein